MVGVCSYLLVSFWFTRIYANQSSVSAFLTNRVGDCFLTIGMFAIIFALGNLDYATVFSLAPYINSDLITVIGICFMIGAMAKSAQLGLHVWLPLAMEGEYLNYYCFLCDLLAYIIQPVSSKIPTNAVYNMGVSPISDRSTTCFKVIQIVFYKLIKVRTAYINYQGYAAPKGPDSGPGNLLFLFSLQKHRIQLGLKVGSVQLLGSKQFVSSLVTTSSIRKSSGPIWVYDITKLYVNNGLDSATPFKTKSAGAKAINITRGTLTLYLDSDKVLHNKWIISSRELSKELLSKYLITSEVWEVVTGELLGDGHISYDPVNKPNNNGRLEFTFAADILYYVNYLKFNVLSSICTLSSPTPWPNPKEGKEPTQYWFGSKSLPAITDLYYLWYKEIDGKWIKVLPSNIEELLTPLALAHFLMGDGYFSEGSVLICSDNYTKEEVLRLIEVLHVKFGIKATLKKRTNPGGAVKWRIRVSKLSIDKLVSLVRPYFISEMLYKLGVKENEQ